MNEQPFKKIWKKGEAILSGIDGLLHGVEGASKPEMRSFERPQNPDLGPHVTIREFMTHDPVSIRIHTPLHEALGVMLERDLSALPVIDENDSIVGLLNERHLLESFGDVEATSVSVVMDSEPVTVGVEEEIVEVVDRLMVINVRQVLVIEGARLVGVVTRADLMPVILEVLQKRARQAHRLSLSIH